MPETAVPQASLPVEDQQFLIDMVNDPDWIAYIGKRDVSTREQAEAYLRQGPRAMCAPAPTTYIGSPRPVRVQ